MKAEIKLAHPKIEGKITKGLITPQMVRRRAKELAKIAGRPVTMNDHRQARAELTEANRARLDQNEIEPVFAAPWQAAQGSAGRRARTKLPDDDQNTERIVAEGQEEAEHSQFVAASKRKRR